MTVTRFVSRAYPLTSGHLAPGPFCFTGEMTVRATTPTLPLCVICGTHPIEGISAEAWRLYQETGLSWGEATTAAERVAYALGLCAPCKNWRPEEAMVQAWRSAHELAEPGSMSSLTDDEIETIVEQARVAQYEAVCGSWNDPSLPLEQRCIEACFCGREECDGTCPRCMEEHRQRLS
jgi:hypothetical protein